ncbi:MAG: hypothetical protein EHM58_13360 [Ignavibacteriae bacterium]|nr:MAG: hypothetical protein EHM58_13360 [Ignavibacteriota bacterium]
MEEMKTLSEMIELLHHKGYIHDMEITEHGLKSKDTDELFKPEELIIEKVYRFEGDSDPADMAVLYGITSNSGTKGTLIDAFGTYQNPRIGEFLKKVRIIQDEH